MGTFYLLTPCERAEGQFLMDHVISMPVRIAFITVQENNLQLEAI